MCGLLFIYGQVSAEIITDGTLGDRVALQAPYYEITQDLGTTVGSNLFHSFEQFNINLGETATFSGTEGIQNVISRVTGGDSSTIDGVLRNTIPNADTYLINPHGILFGPDARLDVQGSFHASTADYLRLGENGRFDASHPNESVLTVAPVEAFGFLDNAPAPIKVENSRLMVSKHNTLSLVGGDLTLKANMESSPNKDTGVLTFETVLFADSGQVNLISLADLGEVKLAERGTFPKSANRGGKIEVFNSGVGAGGQEKGYVFVQASELTLVDSIFNNSTIYNVDGGLIKIITGELNLTGEKHLTAIYTVTLGNGHGPNIEIEATHVNVIGMAAIFSMINGSGDSGDIFIKATDKLYIAGQFIPEVGAPTGIFTISPEGTSGNAGNIEIDVGSVTIDGGLILTITETQGNAGNIHVNVADKLTVTGNFIPEIDAPSGVLNATLSKGNAGNIVIKAEQIALKEGGQILNRTFGLGDSGNIDVIVFGEMIASGADNRNNHSGVTGQAGDNDIHNTGKAANIHIQADKITLLEGGSIESDTSGAGQGGKILIQVNELIISGQDKNIGTASNISASTFSQENDAGDAGRIKIEAKDIQLIDGGAIYNVTMGPGKSGSILVEVDDTLLITGGFRSLWSKANLEQFNLLPSGIFTTTGSAEANSGDGGQIVVTADHIILNAGGMINNDTFGAGHGGSIEVSVAGTLEAEGLYTTPTGFIYPSGVRSSSHNEADYAGNAGSLLIEAENILLSQAAGLSTEAVNAEGGNIIVKVPHLLLLRDNANITTSVYGGTGNGGNITIEDPVFVTLDDSHIEAQADAGNGGNIHIVADNFLQTPCSVISASSRLGLNGHVEIDSPDETISGDLIQLPSNFKRTQHKIETCRSKKREERSHFTIKYLEGVPRNSEDVRSSSFVNK